MSWGTKYMLGCAIYHFSNGSISNSSVPNIYSVNNTVYWRLWCINLGITSMFQYLIYKTEVLYIMTLNDHPPLFSTPYPLALFLKWDDVKDFHLFFKMGRTTVLPFTTRFGETSVEELRLILCCKWRFQITSLSANVTSNELIVLDKRTTDSKSVHRDGLKKN